MAKVTITEVAREAGVSVASVPFILRDVPGYSYRPETVARVRQAALALDYKPHTAARLLRQQQKTLIGLVIRLSVRPHANADMLAGVLSLDLTMEEEVPEFYRELASRIPLVALYPVLDPTIISVYTDVERGVLEAAEHLARLGHRRIAFTKICNSPHLSDNLKISGWHQAVETFNLDHDPGCLIEINAGLSIAELAEASVTLLERIEPRPTALICESDEIAMGILERLATKGWQIPRELSVIGMDGIELGAYSYPPLTTIAIPYNEIARVGVDALMAQIGTPEPAVASCQLIAPSLLLRRSTTTAGSMGELH